MTDELEAAYARTGSPAGEEPAVDPLASWWARAVALAIDVVPGAAVVATMALVCSTVPVYSLWWWGCVSVGGVAIVLTAGNRVLLPTITGWSLGRAVVGVAVVRRDGAPVGPVRLLLRELGHLLDTVAVFVGWMWPLWDPRKRTFADLLARTEVRRAQLQRLPPNLPRQTAVVFVAAALVCAAAAAVSYLVVYQRDRATDTARAQVAAQGPKIVEQMLTYAPSSLREDFARAQSLATDNYRERLVRQQQEVQRAEPVTNEYWATNSSVLAATPNRATMLLFLQGVRGDEPDKQRFISATVRVTFEKSAATWRVDELTVVTKPLPAEDGN